MTKFHWCNEPLLSYDIHIHSTTEFHIICIIYVCTFTCTHTWEVSTRDCTSTEEDDYTALTGTVTLTPTNAQPCVSVLIEDDLVLEETESLTVSLSPTGIVASVQVSQPTTTIVITDDDCKRLITAYALQY